MTAALAASALQCGTGSDAPRAQVVLIVDTDAPIASEVQADKFKSDASVDTLRVEVMGQDDVPVARGSRDIPAPDVANWPISFALEGKSGAKLLRVRLRAFRARDAESSTGDDAGAKVMVPVAGYTIDRVIDVPLPDKGSYVFRVVLEAQCRGARPDFVARTTCVGGEPGSFKDGLEALPVEAGHDVSKLPPRPAQWVTSSPSDCPEPRSTEERVCIPGGFFMLGNRRVVGFGLLRRKDATPAHPVRMKPFWIDRTEMTVGGYKKLREQYPQLSEEPLLASSLASDERCTGPTGFDALPLNCITWDQANDACTRQGGRLPSEAEWEFVASGRGQGLLFPWGDEPPHCTSLNAGHAASPLGLPACGKKDVLGAEDTVGQHAADRMPDPWGQGTAPYVFDLGGSLSEWMNDHFRGYDKDAACWARNGMLEHPGCRVGSAAPEHSVRGGNWADPMEVSYAALRNSNPDSNWSHLIGFRCVFKLDGQDDPLQEIIAGGVDAGTTEPELPPGEPERNE